MLLLLSHFSCVRLCVTPQTAAHQAPPSLGFFRQEHTEELYEKDLHDPDNHNGVITNLEPDILECEVKWALESIAMNKAVEVMEFQSSCFKS